MKKNEQKAIASENQAWLRQQDIDGHQIEVDQIEVDQRDPDHVFLTLDQRREYWIVRDASGKRQLADEKPGAPVKYEPPTDETRDALTDNTTSKRRITITEKQLRSAKTWLRAQRLDAAEIKLVLAVAFHAASQSKCRLATTTGKSREWVADRLPRPRIQDCIRHLRSGKALVAARAKSREQRPRLVDYPRLYLFSRVFDLQLPQSPNESHAVMNPPGAPLSDHVIRIIRDYPETLLNPEHGPEYLTALVDLLTAAKYGECKRRVAGLLPQGTFSEVADKARTALKLLTTDGPSKKGTPPLRLNPFDTYRLIYELANRIHQLQQEANAERGERATRADAIREAHRDELRGVSDMMLKTILTEKPHEAALSLAAKITGNKESVFRRVLGPGLDGIECAFEPDLMKRLQMLQRAKITTAE